MLLMAPLEAVGSVLDEDGKGDYRFDRMTFKNPIGLLGFAPSLHERPNHLVSSEPEREERHRRFVALPEVASPIGIAL